MSCHKLINIGTPENPVMVAESALRPKTDEGRAWWEGLASGSIELDQNDLDHLLGMIDEENK